MTNCLEALPRGQKYTNGEQEVDTPEIVGER